MRPLAVAATVLLAVAGAAAAQACNCSNPAWCAPLTTPPASREVLAFHVTSHGSVWQQFDYTQVTTIAVFGLPVDPALTCFAHSHSVRVVIGVDFDTTQLGNRSAEDAWINGTVATVVAGGLDGVNIDIEQYQGVAPPLVSLTSRLAAAVRAAVPMGQVSFDTAIGASAADPYYDFTALAEACDFLVPMAYDMDWAARVARANSPYDVVGTNLAAYQGLGVAATSIVLGLPWYGYDFPCENVPAPPNYTCMSASGFGPGWSHTFSDIVTQYLPLGPLRYDATSQSPFITYNDSNGTPHQLWYDDEASLSAKYQLASHLHLRGIAMWTADFLDYAGGVRVASMWAALAANFTGSVASGAAPAA